MYEVIMCIGDKRLMSVSFHKTKLDASLAIVRYTIEDHENKVEYKYLVNEL